MTSKNIFLKNRWLILGLIQVGVRLPFRSKKMIFLIDVPLKVTNYGG